MLNPNQSALPPTSPTPTPRNKRNLHVANIKQTRLLPRPLMTLNMAEVRILQRHRVPRKRHHASPPRNMQIIQLRLLRGLCVRPRRRRIPHLRWAHAHAHGRLVCQPDCRSCNRRGGAEGSRKLSRGEHARAIGDDAGSWGGQRFCAQKAGASSQWLHSRHGQ